MHLRPRTTLALLATVAAAGAATTAAAQTGPSLDPPAETAFLVTLNGTAEVPGPGDADGAGTARVTVNATTGQVCVNLSTANIDPITGMHIHEGAVGVAGPVRVDLGVTSGTSAAKCVQADATQAQAIAATPANFYLNVHTAANPDGAIRGQLTERGEDVGGLRLLATPVRAHDTRNPGQQKLENNGTRVVDLTTGANGQPSGLPIGARAAIVTLTVTQTVDGGYLTLYSNALTSNPGTSTINWTQSNQDVATTATVAVDGAGRVKVSAGPRGTHVIVDVIGYYF
jgi:hypothetical protein